MEHTCSELVGKFFFFWDFGLYARFVMRIFGECRILQSKNCFKSDESEKVLKILLKKIK